MNPAVTHASVCVGLAAEYNQPAFPPCRMRAQASTTWFFFITTTGRKRRKYRNVNEFLSFSLVSI
jgi:hypothetical protein